MITATRTARTLRTPSVLTRKRFLPLIEIGRLGRPSEGLSVAAVLPTIKLSPYSFCESGETSTLPSKSSRSRAYPRHMTVTVLVPTHDHGPLLRLSLRSALTQTVSELEIFVVGDGVPD